jgi:dipeptidyl aminopeptidase/acylaminoacyl peptidase
MASSVRTNAHVRRLFPGLALALAAAMGCNPVTLVQTPTGGSSGNGSGGAGGSGSTDSAGGAGGAGGAKPASCDAALTLAQGEDLSHHIAVDATHVYWTTEGLTYTIRRTPRCGGEIETLYEGKGFADLAGALAVDETAVYWVGGLGNGDWGVRSMPKAGGPITNLTSGDDSVGGIALDSDHVYFSSSCGAEVCIRRVQKTGGGLDLVAGGQHDVVDLAVDAKYVHWIAYPQGSGQLVRAPKAGGPAEYLTTMQEEPQSIAVDGDFVYISASKESVYVHVVKVPLAGEPAPIVLVSGVQGSPGEIAVDGSHVYYAVGPALDGPSAVFRVPKQGGNPEALTKHEPWPFALAIDDAGVYFTNDEWQGTVKRTPK